MSKKWSSFEDDALIMESWRKHINEEDVEEDQDQQQPLEEAVLTAAVVAKLIFALSQKDNIKKVINAALARQGDLPESVVTILKTIDSAVEVIEKELPVALRAAVELRAKAPDSWAGNFLASLLAAVISKTAPLQPEEEEATTATPPSAFPLQPPPTE